MSNTAQSDRQAVVYRMVLADHQCPHGLKAKALLQRKGYVVEDRPLRSRAAIDTFKADHHVATTPQVFIDGVRVGGFEDLRRFFGARPRADVSYGPVIALFSVAAVLALAVTWLASGQVFAGLSLAYFIAISMVLLGLQKLKDLDRFASMFLGYDLLARRWVPYAYIYPFIETGAGVLMLAGVLTWLAAPVALVAASIGAASVFKAVYIDRRSLKCACVGGDSRVPLGFVSLLENLMMMGMAVWMLWP